MEFIKDTIGQILDKRSKCTPEEVALIVKDGVYKWKDVNVIVNAICLDMIENGIKKGDKVGIIGINSDSWIFHFFAVLRLGAIAVLLNTRFTQTEIERCVRLTDTKYIFYSRNTEKHRYDDIVGELIFPNSTLQNCFFIEKSYEQWMEVAEENIQIDHKIDIDSEDVACVLFTSGTTGNSKGVQLSHFSLVNNSLSMSRKMRWNEQDIMCVAVPLFHSFGITGCILSMLHAGGKLYMLQSTRSVEICEVIEKYKCTVMNGVPTMFLAMYKNKERKNYDLSSLKSGIIAGSQIFPQDYLDICSMFDHINLQPSYGQTETSPCVSLCDLDDLLELKANTVGKIIDGVSVRIMKKNGTKPCGTNVEGEIQIKGYNLMKGYISNPEETKNAFTEDGWLKSGDLGYIRDDGYLVVTGRYKNLIIRGGENISPIEIERAMKEVLNGQEVKVFGIPTVVLQEDIVACVEGKEDNDLRNKIIEHLKDKISDYKIPRFILFMEEMPRNSTGKINEKVLKNKVIADMMK